MPDVTPKPEKAPLSNSRSSTLQGLRGLAILLVMVSHAWVIWPTEDVLASPLGGFFRSGNLGVSVFFVLAGYFMVRAFLDEVDRTQAFDFMEAFFQRWVRLSAHVYTLVLAMLVAAAVLPMGFYAPSDTGRSAFRIITYTWNWFAMRQPLLSRPDAGHLWFTSVYVQVMILFIALVALLGRRRKVLVIVLAALLVAVITWRHWSYVNEGEWVAFLRTTARMDGLLWGALLAAGQQWLPRPSRKGGDALLIVGAGALLVLSFLADNPTYFGVEGTLICIATAVVIHTVMSGAHGVAGWVLSVRPLVLAGNYSMALYIWHYPVYWLVSRRFPEWAAGPKVIVSVVAIVVLAYLAQRWIEEPLGRWLRTRRTAKAVQRGRRTPADAPTGLRER